MPRGIPNDKRKRMSDEARKRISEAMKARHAAKKDNHIQSVADQIASKLKEGRDAATLEHATALAEHLSFESKKQLILALVESLEERMEATEKRA